MQGYAVDIAKAIKKVAKSNKNELRCFVATIQKQEPLIVNALGGELVFEEGKNLVLTEDIKQKMISDPERKEYLGRKAMLLGYQKMTVFDILV